MFSREWRSHPGVWKYRAPVSAAGGHEGVCVRGAAQTRQRRTLNAAELGESCHG